MTVAFDHELHIHLYGCLSAEDVWELGKDRWQRCRDALSWYEDEYAKAWGRRPNSAAYWTDSEDGLNNLRKDFLFTQHSPFPRFQACFNLLIALFKIRPGEHFVLKRILDRHLAGDLRYIEYRTVIPSSLSKQELADYFSAQAQLVLAAEQASSGQFCPRIAYSLSRDQTICNEQYKLLRSWLSAEPSLAAAVVGIDFSYFEAGYPPIGKKAFMQRVRADNLINPDQALGILYHVGESFDHLSIESAARWVWEAHAYGAHRLGHGIAAGMDPMARLGHTVYEEKAERLYHHRWLTENESWLQRYGYTVDYDEIAQEQATLQLQTSHPPGLAKTVTLADIDRIRQFQHAILADLADRGAIFESCPTSNFRIGSIVDPNHHPLKTFLRQGVQVCISTDDPGIFAISLASEADLCRQHLDISDVQLSTMAANTRNYRSRVLAAPNSEA